MKTFDIFSQATMLLLLTAVMAYLVNYIFDAPIVWAWAGSSFILFAGYVGEYMKFKRDQSPTLLTERNKILSKKLQNKTAEADQIKNLIIREEELESEVEIWKSQFETAKAAFELQKAEVKRMDKSFEQIKSELEKGLSETQAKLQESEANARQWGAEKSQAKIDNQTMLDTIKANDKNHRIIVEGLEANLATAETTISQYAEALSDLIDKFGYGILTSDWGIFKPAMNRLTTKYNTNKMNATTSQESRQALMLTAESVETFSEFLPQEADIIE